MYYKVIKLFKFGFQVHNVPAPTLEIVYKSADSDMITSLLDKHKLMQSVWFLLFFFQLETEK